MRGQELIGRTLLVSDAIVDGRGKVKVGDGVWLARGPDTAAGTRVKVIGLEGTVLQVAPEPLG
jgi:membrane protein implicated in regulation of membrane protease activity